MALILRALCKNAVPLTRSMAWFNRRPTADERSRKYREKHRKQDGDNTEDDGKPKKKYGQEV